ncbi:SAF domain-containing protein [Nocardioides daphniae]|uniref:Pilus assembly protein CpaB n=1 Tax=Nocardioides daphniae TaxID=402297 RepID=A0A4P7UE22_9ACTN|nr:SAF domain-containing protein [Nocardioides daphniae]QCC78124.1 pilus assembly protein CpaB [Nocardioides daphniae]
MPAPESPTGRPRLRVRRWWRRHVLAHRRGLAACCVAVAALATLRTVAPPPPPVVETWVAARDLPAGTALTASDVELAAYAVGTVPDGVVAAPAGRRLASPLRRGEPVTDARVLGPDLLEGYPGRTAVPVRVPDATVVDLVRVGDTVDLVSADPSTGRAATVARDAPVVALPPDPEGVSGQVASGRVVVVALAPDDVDDVTVAAVQQFLTVVWSR